MSNTDHYGKAMSLIDDTIDKVNKSKGTEKAEEKNDNNNNKDNKHLEIYSTTDSASASASKRSLSRVNLQARDTVVSQICLIYAMLAEASPIIDHYKLIKDEKMSKECYPCIVYHSKHDGSTNIPNNCDIYVVLNGKDKKYECDRVGTQAAAITTYNVIRYIKPDIIINAGTCGGIDAYTDTEIKENNEKCMKKNEKELDDGDHHSIIPDIVIGQVYIGNISIYCDRNIPIDPWKDWGLGYYQLFGTNKLAKHLNLPLANVCTGNSFAHSEKEILICKTENGICKEMELASIAEVCFDFNIPLIALKGITDFVTHPAGPEQFLKNLKMTGENVAKNTIKTVDYVVGKKLGDLE